MSEVVLAYPRGLIDGLLPEGFSNPMPRTELAAQIAQYSIWRDRAELKAAADAKQVIDYGVYIIQHPDEPDRPDEISMYQRSKMVGEHMLMGNHSVGYGGHPEVNADRRDDAGGTTDFVATLEASRQREESEEVVVWTEQGDSFKPVAQHFGYVNDNSDAIGQLHFAAVSVTLLPPGSFLLSNEPNQSVLGNYTLPQLVSETFFHHPDSQFENWSTIVLQALLPHFDAQGKFSLTLPTTEPEPVDPVETPDEPATESESPTEPQA